MPKRSFLRGHDHHAAVTNIELFFDLVFVYAITQLSHSLLHDLSLKGALHTGMLMLAVWWVWIFTCWVTNWLDPERDTVRGMLFVLMLLGLVLSAAIPHAFEAAGASFAVAYVGMQVGRSLFTLWAIGDGDARHRANFQRICCWLVVSGVFWLIGGFGPEEWRLYAWGIALVIEYASPLARFWVPGLGQSSTSDWRVQSHHMAERCGLFVIIALGESILATGAGYAKLPVEGGALLAFIVTFIGSAAMWWIYFDSGAQAATAHFAAAKDTGRVARLAYTYLHLPIIAGIILCAVADDMVLEHATGHAARAAQWLILGGPALYLLGNTLFKFVVYNQMPLSHLIGFILLLLAALLAGGTSPLVLSAISSAALAVVAVWEKASRTGLIRF